MTDRAFRTAATAGVSLDGFIARPDGDIEWLTTRGAQAGETGYLEFMAGIDTLALGRKTYEKVLTFGFWPYDGKRVAVLSTTLTTDDPRVTVHRTLDDLLAHLASCGAERVYVDGGQLIQTFLREDLLDEITLTTAPVLIGSGIPLFGPLDQDLDLRLTAAKVLDAGFMQTTYAVTRR
ncbi:dihydrofolate reductase family protein [Streptomyces antimicrobicus]|uniref:Dihydrofolate reductase family protein n=1 Tax=Streptomyces antimicrobicus TaxID=2883108 RepID=A0ABS8B1I4_9ACTN|nr:dihydrofolate reductase family protein [Streptomyces antimicrobicus]MCB5178449.1 dihydrofolate reductase family protein [Streptomyces antimicrobicus]